MASSFLPIGSFAKNGKMQAVEEMLTYIWEENNLATLFDEFIMETERVVHENTDSYFHDNGFDKIVLFQDNETKMKMRLHIWYPMLIPGQRRPRQNVHNHRWDFSSLVLTGQATNLTYRIAGEGENGEELYHYYPTNLISNLNRLMIYLMVYENCNQAYHQALQSGAETATEYYT